MVRSLAVIILAAGKGTRMNALDKAKVMFEISGVPMIDYVVRQAESLESNRIVVIVGFQREAVMEHLRNRFGTLLEYAHQEQQLGTGHAVMQAESVLQDFHGDVLILSGDVPLLRTETLRTFVEEHRLSNAVLSVLSVDAPNPIGYGRIVRDTHGNFERIVEQKDASEAERAITEINSGIYLVRSDALFTALQKVSNSNTQGEYYLTDIVSILWASGEAVSARKSLAFDEVQGVNTPEHLRAAQEQLEKSDVLAVV
jgi:UDP-N-acetylglucosamine pyrophosphorylase